MTALTNFEFDISKALYCVLIYNFPLYLTFNMLHSFQKWYDTRLTWDPTVYGNETSFITGHQQVWTPPLLLANA